MKTNKQQKIIGAAMALLLGIAATTATAEDAKAKKQSESKTKAQAQAQPQQPADPAAQAAQQALGPISPMSLLDVSLRVAQQIDADKAKELWADASPVVRSGINDADFAKGVSKMRLAPGTPKVRSWLALSLVDQPTNNAAKVPPGLYANCVFLTKFTAETINRETVSFHLDSDNRWRLAGYSIQ